MADAGDSMKATNVSLTPPEQDLRDGGRDYPPGQRERVPVDSGGLHAAPTYAAALGRTIDPGADPASPSAGRAAGRGGRGCRGCRRGPGRQ